MTITTFNTVTVTIIVIVVFLATMLFYYDCSCGGEMKGSYRCIQESLRFRAWVSSV